MGIGRASGKDKAQDAANMAISSPLLETSINGATGVIINITSSPDIGLDDIDYAASAITNAAHPDATIIWGAAFNEEFQDEMQITVIATGFDQTMSASNSNTDLKHLANQVAQKDGITTADFDEVLNFFNNRK